MAFSGHLDKYDLFAKITPLRDVAIKHTYHRRTMVERGNARLKLTASRLWQILCCEARWQHPRISAVLCSKWRRTEMIVFPYCLQRVYRLWKLLQQGTYALMHTRRVHCEITKLTAAVLVNELICRLCHRRACATSDAPRKMQWQSVRSERWLVVQEPDQLHPSLSCSS